MFSQIQNPETGKWVNVNGKVGKKVLNNYVNHLDQFSIGGGLLNSITQFLDSFSSNKKNDQVNSDQVNSEPIKTTYQQKIEPGSNILPSQNHNSQNHNSQNHNSQNHNSQNHDTAPKNYKIAG